MKKDLKLQQHLNIINAKLDFLISAQGKTVITRGAFGNKPVFISGEEQFIKWVGERNNIKKEPVNDK